MSYKNTLQYVNTEKALSLIEIEYQAQGAYVKFPCPSCGQQAVIKAYGDKKNLYYCPKCKASGHIISLVMKKKGISWEESSKFLEKATNTSADKISQPLTLYYELQYTSFLENKGLSEVLCRNLEIGVPKGKTMLAGCVAFAVRDEVGVRVAYYGIKMKDGKPIFHKSFNPEHYLYNYHALKFDETVYFTTDMFECAKRISNNQQTICNYGLPYLSTQQLELLNKIEYLIVSVDEAIIKPLAMQLLTTNSFIKFE